MPEVADASVAEPITRKEKFRLYFRAFNPTVSPVHALQEGFVLSDLRPDLVHKKIAARVELEPGSRQALVGGIGSGKTTELLLVRAHLVEHGIEAHYLEVSRFADVSQLKPGFLVGLVAQQLLLALGQPSFLAEEAKRIEDYLYGYWQHDSERVQDYDPPDPYYSFVGGVAKRPIQLELQLDEGALRALVTVAGEYRKSKSFALLVDGLDRVSDIGEFRRLALPDLVVLRKLEIPVVCVAPLALQFSAQTDIREQFDRIHELSAIRTHDESLLRLLAVRDSQSLFTPGAVREAAQGSGGLLRDLITIARDAGEAAYVSGSERIEADHVRDAVRQLGLSYSRGLSHRQVELLRATAKTGGFDPTDPEMMYLLGSRRVVEYSSTSFAIHPALKKVLNLDAF